MAQCVNGRHQCTGVKSSTSTSGWSSLKFDPRSPRSGLDFAIGELKLRKSNQEIPLCNCIASSSQGIAQHAIDGTSTTSWVGSLRHTKSVPLILTCPTAIEVDEFTFVTGSDKNQDPRTWALSGSTNGTSGPWTELQVQMDPYSTPNKRRTEAGWFVCNATAARTTLCSRTDKRCGPKFFGAKCVTATHKFCSQSGYCLKSESKLSNVHDPQYDTEQGGCNALTAADVAVASADAAIADANAAIDDGEDGQNESL